MNIKFEREITLVGNDVYEYLVDVLGEAGVTWNPEDAYTPQLEPAEVSLLRIGDEVSCEIPMQDRNGNPGSVEVLSSVAGRMFERPQGSGETTLVIYLLPAFAYGKGSMEAVVPGGGGHTPRPSDRLYYLYPLDDRGRHHKDVRLALEAEQVLAPGETLLIPSWQMGELVDDILDRGQEGRFAGFLDKKESDARYRLTIVRVVHDLSFRGTYVYVK